MSQPEFEHRHFLPKQGTGLAIIARPLGKDTKSAGHLGTPFVSDGSTDGSTEFIEAWAQQDASVKLVVLARNLGHQNAVSAGRWYASGTPLRRALEIGYGNGIARQMLERDLGLPVDGCDLNRTALERAKPGKGRLFVCDIFDEAPSLLGGYDAVFCWM